MHDMPRESSPTTSFQLFGLLIKCPFERELVGCPLLPLRTMASLEEKYLFTEQFSDHEAQELLAAHQACYLARLARCLCRERPGLARQTQAPHRRPGPRQGGLKELPANF